MLGKIKIKIFVASLVAALMAFISTSTLAYYSTVGKATNVVTSGEVQLAIHETTDQGTEFPAEGVYVLPGDVVSKQVSVENVCDHPFYLRVKIVYGINAEELSASDCFKLNINEQDWVWQDGWYYYTRVLQSGETSPLIFSKVEIVGDMIDNSDIGKTLTLSVKAHAVQSENNPTDAPWQAAGWPQE